jgi:hypothetical protein
LRCLVQLLDRLLVVSQVHLAADEDDGQARAEVHDLGVPLLLTRHISTCLRTVGVTHRAMGT